MKLLDWVKQNYILTLILVVAAVLRFYHIDYQSVWLDEIHTINEADPNKTLSEMYSELLIAEPHPPLYFLLVHYAFIIFGYTTMVLRVLSAIIGLAGIFGIYALGKEIFNKKVGLFAAILITVNYFHLNYSQDGRMYALLFLTTTFSFLFLVRFIKKPSIKTGLVYGFFSALMIYSHFFALFALCSQYLILLYFVVMPFNISRKKFFYYCLIAGISTLILYLPTYELFRKTSEMKSIWIQMPTLDAYTQIFKDFFGQSEIVLWFVFLLLLLFFIQLFKENDSEKLHLDPDKDKLVFSFILIFGWVMVTLILPLIRTYLSLPMLINRYFINILPAVIIVVAIALFYIKNKTIQYSILSIIVIFSLTDIIIVKDYYRKVSKTQFREVTQFIIDNNKKKDPVYTSLGWYFPYFLKNDKVQMNIVDKPLEVLVSEMMQDSTKRINFWYVDGHNKPYTLSEPSQKFLDDNFVVEDNAELFDCWTKFYVKNSEALAEIDLSKYKPLKEEAGAKLKFWIDSFEMNSEYIKADGWAYIDGQSATDSDIKIVLISNDKAYRAQTQKLKREDITKATNNGFNLDNSGFSSKTKIAKLQNGKYRLGIIVKDKKTNIEGLVLTDKNFDIIK